MTDNPRYRTCVVAASAAFLASLGIVAAPPAHSSSTAFETAVQPFLAANCQTCHSAKLAVAGLSIEGLSNARSTDKNREQWEKVVARIASGEMPPRGEPMPDAGDVQAVTAWLRADFLRQDKLQAPEPGRVIAHRLNRAEYANAVRDLLGVQFRPEDEFPADDSGYGFDNIGDVLTVSPTLMQKYMSSGERIAARAVGSDPLPKAGFTNRRKRLRRIDSGHLELRDIVEYDAEYIIRAYLIGHRGAQDKPVTLVLSVDGKLIRTLSVPVQISAVNQQAGETQRAIHETRVFLPDGEHLFSAGFVDDDAVEKIPVTSRLNQRENIYVDVIEIGGPFAPAQPHTAPKKVLICDPASGAACVERILSTLARRAYRRPVTKQETGDLVRIFNEAKKSGCPPLQSLQFAITSLLVSPNFLFRIEQTRKAGAVARLNDFELASRLSFFLWSSIPDDALLNLAEANKLHTPAVLDAQVKRMMADNRSGAFAENFAGQWLETRSLNAVKPDPVKFPDWRPELKEAMATETQMFFESVMREDRPVSDFIDGKYTFLNELLAKHYGITGITGPQFRRVELTTDQRSGVFTQGSVLTVSSYPTRTSVVLRGKYLLENMLNAPPPPPPPDVPALNEAAVGVAQTLRKQMERHRADPTCASCHSRMDPLGFGLENYDAIGRWRTEDGKFPVDASGAFPNGKEFSSPASMKVLLRDHMPDFTRCIAEKMLTYSLGRGLESFDRRTVQEIATEAAEHEYRFHPLVLAIVHSVPFQMRRGEVSQTSLHTAGVTHR
jgi:mono/diheme cytochrome c family protein